MRVLLVEDEVELAEAISKGLREASYAVDMSAKNFDNSGNGSPY